MLDIPEFGGKLFADALTHHMFKPLTLNYVPRFPHVHSVMA